MSICLITSRQVEALCRYDRPSQRLNREFKKEPVTVVPKRTPASPSLNFNDVPEAGFTVHRIKSYGKAHGGLRVRVRPSKAARDSPGCPTVLEENEENEEWPYSHDDELVPEAAKEVQAQWPCACCTFLNDALMNVCELCDQPRTPTMPATTMFPEAQVVTDSKNEKAAVPASEGKLGRNWPSLRQSLQQATEKSWDFCEQSSVASSMVDVATLADVDGLHKDVAMPVKVVPPAEVSSAEFFDIMSDTGSQAAAPAEVCSAELYDIMSTSGSQVADKEQGDTSSMASWLHLGAASEVSNTDDQGNCASAASSWVDIGNLADFEGHPEPDDATARGARSVATWSSLVSERGSMGRVTVPSRSGVPVPPLRRCQAARKKDKKAAVLQEDDEHYDDQDGRARGRASQRYRRRR
mmetsp:Transcript_1353/g.2391  ORF Transcript_1353/g.2391 Transcript_1353/m.2391 type:complete len:410 (-) Transcript_1353:79-1308(-)